MQPQPRAPILAAFSPKAAGIAPVESALAASHVTGAPIVVVAVSHGDAPVQDVDDADGRPHSVKQLEQELAARGVEDVEIRIVDDHTPARGLARAIDEL